MKKLSLLFLITIALVGCDRWKGKEPGKGDLGIRIVGYKVAFKPCPDKPNCISTFAQQNQPKNIVEPIKTGATREKALETTLGIILKDKNAKLVNQTEHYLHATYTSSVFKFVDDVEFFFKQKGHVHFKSASRAGFYDMGTNKERMEAFKFKFHQNGM
jgi:uncharacterized protein (DUF1499 family)